MSPHRTLEQDATHRDPLPGLEEQLVLEFGEQVPKEQLHSVAEQALHLYDEARVREFVAVFAWRMARKAIKLGFAATL